MTHLFRTSRILGVLVIANTNESGESERDSSFTGLQIRGHAMSKLSMSQHIAIRIAPSTLLCTYKAFGSCIDRTQAQIGGQNLPNDLGLKEHVRFRIADIVVAFLLSYLERFERREMGVQMLFRESSAYGFGCVQVAIRSKFAPLCPD